MREMKGAIFDLDGVVCDTAKYHFLAWRELASRLGFEFTERENERLKGVSRKASLDILLSVGNIAAPPEQKEIWMEQKNARYLEYIRGMTKEEILPGVKGFMEKLKSHGIRIALGSASKNARIILEQLEIAPLFDFIVDGTMVHNPKPDPEVFLKAAEGLGLQPEQCLVFEDAQAGFEAARAGGIKCVGVGDFELTKGADYQITGFLDERLLNLR